MMRMGQEMRLRGYTGGRKAGCSTKYLLSPLRIGTESEEKPQQVICSRAGDETRGLDMEGRRESEKLSLFPCFTSLLDWWVPRKCLLESGTVSLACVFNALKENRGNKNSTQS